MESLITQNSDPISCHWPINWPIYRRMNWAKWRDRRRTIPRGGVAESNNSRVNPTIPKDLSTTTHYTIRILPWANQNWKSWGMVFILGFLMYGLRSRFRSWREHSRVWGDWWWTLAPCWLTTSTKWFARGIRSTRWASCTGSLSRETSIQVVCCIILGKAVLGKEMMIGVDGTTIIQLWPR